MALVWDIQCNDQMDVDEFLDHVQATVDVQDVDSLASCAPALRALANDREFVLRAFHEELKACWSGSRRNEHQPQSIQIRNSADFYIRANIWLPIAQGSRTETFQKRLYAYDLPHDHNFNFLTVGYFGEGYTTDIYEYRHENCVGFVGEDAGARFAGRYKLEPGRVMLYRSGRDVHIQYAPETVSVSLNLMGRNIELDRQQQYIFDMEQGRLIGGAGDVVSNRLFLVEAAAYLADDETVGILHDLVAAHPCGKTRARALQSLDSVAPSEGERARSTACAETLQLSRLPLITGNYARSYSGA
jgi:hypothetical protein